MHHEIIIDNTSPEWDRIVFAPIGTTLDEVFDKFSVKQITRGYKDWDERPAGIGPRFGKCITGKIIWLDERIDHSIGNEQISFSAHYPIDWLQVGRFDLITPSEKGKGKHYIRSVKLEYAGIYIDTKRRHNISGANRFDNPKPKDQRCPTCGTLIVIPTDYATCPKCNKRGWLDPDYLYIDQIDAIFSKEEE
ncbi:MAG: hypothetical protein HXS54_06175 [Theionarchaea archaeon]|nr:hypothetical protein [Theionarchaea archaeon]DBA34845.1 TPA_asm: hypothetical protein vir521_00051 [Caudoviricetes sp. vir521]